MLLSKSEQFWSLAAGLNEVIKCIIIMHNDLFHTFAYYSSGTNRVINCMQVLQNCMFKVAQNSLPFCMKLSVGKLVKAIENKKLTVWRVGQTKEQ